MRFPTNTLIASHAWMASICPAIGVSAEGFSVGLGQEIFGAAEAIRRRFRRSAHILPPPKPDLAQMLGRVAR